MSMSCRTFLVLLFCLVLAVPLAAQTDDRDPRHRTADDRRDEPLFRAWLKLQGHYYENFFQEPDPAPGENVGAGYGEIGTSLRLSRNSPIRAYASVNYLQFDDSDLDSTNGFRVGLHSEGRPHAFDVYGDFQSDRPTFDVGDEFDRADIRSFVGEYSYRFAGDWQVTAEGELQQQDFELTPSRDNDFSAVGGAVRYRGWRRFSPEIGVRLGSRDVDDPTFSYDQDDWYVQVRSSITPVYLSVRYRMRNREYTTDNPTVSNFGREDDRRQIAALADWTLSEMIVLNFYAAREEADTNLEGRDFDTAMYAAGLTFRF